MLPHREPRLKRTRMQGGVGTGGSPPVTQLCGCLALNLPITAVSGGLPREIRRGEQYSTPH